MHRTSAEMPTKNTKSEDHKNNRSAVKDEKCKLDAIVVASQRPTAIPFDIKRPNIDLKRKLDVFPGETVEPEPCFFLASEMAHRRIEHSRSCATALKKCREVEKEFAPLTMATSKKISTFLEKVDSCMNAYAARQAKARVELFADQYQTEKRIESMFEQFIDNIKNDIRSLIISDVAYEAIVGSERSSYSINRASPTKRTSNNTSDPKPMRPLSKMKGNKLMTNMKRMRSTVPK